MALSIAFPQIPPSSPTTFPFKFASTPRDAAFLPVICGSASPNPSLQFVTTNTKIFVSIFLPSDFAVSMRRLCQKGDFLTNYQAVKPCMSIRTEFFPSVEPHPSSIELFRTIGFFVHSLLFFFGSFSPTLWPFPFSTRIRYLWRPTSGSMASPVVIPHWVGSIDIDFFENPCLPTAPFLNAQVPPPLNNLFNLGCQSDSLLGL